MDFLTENSKFTAKINRETLADLVKNGQHPVATVIGCSDSRVPVELIFDQLEPGQLFVIRVAGNIVAGMGVIGSIEYAIEHLKTPYLIVLGHSDCGAVKAKLAGVTEGTVGELVSHVHVQSSEVDSAILENLNHQVGNVKAIPCVKAAVDAGSLTVHGMMYDLASGQVRLIS